MPEVDADFSFPPLLEYPPTDGAHLAHLEAASVTPSQSASQTAHGGRYGGMAQGYQRPAFPDGAPHESAEERERAGERDDSDASSENDDDGGVREYEDARAHFNNLQSPPAPTPPAKNAPDAAYFERGAAPATNPAPPQAAAPAVRPQAPPQTQPHPQPQMHLVTAPRFNYDGTQLNAVPTAPRLYTRRDDDAPDDSSSDDEPRNTTAHQGWSSRRNRGGGGGDDSSDEDAGPAAKPTRPKAEKRSSFLGKVGKLFKTDLKDSEGGQDARGHRRHNSTSDRGGDEQQHHGGSIWRSRTDRNLRNASTRSNSGRPTLTQPLAHSNGNESSSSDDEDARGANLVRHVNPAWSGRKASSDVGGVLKRTPSQQHSITAGPLSARQKREQEERERSEAERKAHAAVVGAGIGAASTLPRRSNTVRTTDTSTTKKKKKKAAGAPTGAPRRAGSIAGSEVGTAPTRSTPLVTATAPPPARPASSYIVSGDLSSGNRGLASLVLPSDIAKDEQSQRMGYPSQLQLAPPPGTGLSRSNSTATATTVRSTATAKKKKAKRQSAIADGPGTGLTSMSPRDGGKYTTNNWVSGGGGGAAPAAVANAGLVAHTPASQEQIAKKQLGVGGGLGGAHQGASIPRPSSAQSTPLKSAMKHREAPVQASSADAAAVASLGPAVRAPPSASAVLGEAQRTPLAPVATRPPVIPDAPLATPLEEKVRPEPEPTRPSSSSMNLGEDQRFDGSGRLFMSRENSSAEGMDAALASAGADSPSAHRARTRPDVPTPKIDMPSSEPFNIDLARLDARRQGSVGGNGNGNGGLTAADVGDDSGALTPNETAAYQKWLENAPAESAQQQQPVVAAPRAAATSASGSGGVSRVTADRRRIGSAVGYDGDGGGGGDAKPHSLPAQPSRTYSSEGKTLHTPRSSVAAPPHSSLAATLMLPTGTSHSDVSAVGTASDGGAGGGLGRRKSVRIAPDTKLRPETPPGEEKANGGRISDGFGGFILPHASASAAGAPRAASPAPAAPPSQLSSRIAPPPQAPPRLPNKDEGPIQLERERERERSSWTTRIDRRLASAYDSSDDEDAGRGGGGGDAGAGEEIDAYASARRAMGVAHRHWAEATGGSAKKKKTAGGGTSAADTGSVRSKGSKKKSTKSSTGSTGYNKDIPLPKGMEVVGRQKASRG